MPTPNQDVGRSSRPRIATLSLSVELCAGFGRRFCPDRRSKPAQRVADPEFDLRQFGGRQDLFRQVKRGAQHAGQQAGTDRRGPHPLAAIKKQRGDAAVAGLAAFKVKITSSMPGGSAARAAS